VLAGKRDELVCLLGDLVLSQSVEHKVSCKQDVLGLH
jgi:hypothetical protein